MKKIVFILSVIILPKAYSQFSPNYSLNYYDQVAHWTSYYDSVRTVKYSIGDTLLKGIGYGKFQQWMQYWDNFMPQSGNFQEAYSIQNQFMNQKKYEHILGTQTISSNSLVVPAATWTELGPIRQIDILGLNGSWYNPQSTISQTDNFDYFGAHMGLVNRLYQHPTEPNKIFALCGGGGLFMSSDNGDNWKILGTDKIPSPNVIAFAIKPLGQSPSPGIEIMYIGLTAGNVYRSTDAGSSWIEADVNTNSEPGNMITYPIPPPSGWPTNEYNNSLPYFFAEASEATHKFLLVATNSSTNPYSRLLVACKGGLFYSNNYDASLTASGNNLTNDVVWKKYNAINDLLNPSIGGLVYVNGSGATSHTIHAADVEQFKKLGTFYLIAHIARTEFNGTNVLGVYDYVVISADDGLTWSFLGGTTGSMNANGHLGHKNFVVEGNLEVVASDPEFVYFNVLSLCTCGYELIRYSFITNKWTDISEYSTALDHHGIQCTANSFALNPQNEHDYWVSMNQFFHKINDVDVLGTPYADYGNRRHPDTRDFLIIDNQNQLIATDGGVYKSNDGGLTYIPTSNGTPDPNNSWGMGAAQSDGIGLAQQPPFYVASGFYHCGFQIYNPDEDKWHFGTMSDGKGGDIAFLNKEKFTYFAENYGYPYVLSNYNTFPTTNTFYSKGSSIAWSENKAGLSYIFQFTGYPSYDTYKAYRSTNDLSSVSMLNLLSGYNFYHTPRIYTVSNDVNKIAIVHNAFGVTTQLDFFDNMLGTPIHGYSKSLDALYSNLCGVPNIKAGFQDILFDPNDPKHFYMILKGGVNYAPNCFKGRIVEFDPVLNDYVDITFKTDDQIFGGPPNEFPAYIYIRSIEMDRQTGILYIGTSAGVYYLDRDIATPSNSTWRRYSTNIPYFNSDIGIVHCQGEIYTSTPNRGIWKAPLIRDNVPTREWVIKNNTTWDSRMNLFCTLVVDSAVTLTVKDTLVVYGYQKIIVKRGGTLVIDGGIVTTQCGDLWEGIRVCGNRNRHQYPVVGTGQYFQGRLILKNGAIVENAKEAIRLHDAVDGYNTSGGIVQAKDATIRNVFRGAEFLSYRNYNPNIPSQTRNNVSYFKNVTFELTHDLPNNLLPYAFVSMWDVAGVQFNGCTFQNNFPPSVPILDATYSGRGIYTEDANFIIDDYCTILAVNCPPANTIHSKFKNLHIGIQVNKISANKPFTVNNAIFENCIFGAISTGVSNMEIKDNDFTIGDWPGVPYSYQQLGIGLLYNLTGYTITGNEFTEAVGANPQLSLGIWNLNTGPNSKTIKSNCFTNMYRGIQAELKNRSGSGITGLDYLCNNLTGSDYDFFITKGLLSNPLNPTYGIKDFQGSLSVPAGNQFTSGPTDYNILNTSGNVITYFYGPGSNQNPLVISPTVVKIPIGFNPSCISCTASSGLASTLTVLEQEYISSDQPYVNYKNMLQTLIDGGNTPSLQSRVSTSNNSETMDLRNELLGQSPYLSEDVLKTASNKTDVLPEAILFEILLANPNALKKPGLMKHLKDKAVPLPDWMILLLEANKGNVTLRTLIESALSHYASVRAEKITKIITHFESQDSVRNEVELRGWYSLYDTYQADFAIVESYIKEGNYDAAEDFLGTIEGSHKMEASELEDLEDYTSFVNFYIGIRRAGKQINQLDPNEVDQLEQIANNSDEYTGSARAKGILNFFYGFDFSVTPTLPSQIPKVMDIHVPMDVTEHIDVYPIPATDWVAFSYQMKPDLTNVVLDIYNSMGVAVAQIKLGNSIGVFVADVSQYAAGAYHYRISSQGNTVFTGTLVIQ